MGNLHHIFGGAYTPPAEKIIASPESQLLDAMQAAGIEAPVELYFDGKIHRFRTGTKGGAAGDKTGWYVLFNDGVPAGKFGCWRAGIEANFRADIGRSFTAAEEMAHTRRMAEARALRDIEVKKQHENTANTVDTIWSSCTLASPEHPYLKRKGIDVHGARVTGDGRLVVPLFDAEGTLSSLQYIDSEGGKLYHVGGATSGCYWQLGASELSSIIYIAEGFATAATIHQVTNQPCVVAYSASNLVPVLGTLRENNSDKEIVIVADNDKSGVGQRYAEQAAAKYGARIVVMPLEGDANDYVKSGHDLSILLAPPVSENWLIQADDFSSQPAPIRWLIKDWLQDNALIMVHGPSGGGKTFIVLDMALRIASDLPDWAGKKVTHGGVVYLAGEGHHGLRSRIAAFKHHNRVKNLSAWISKDGCDLNTVEGYARARQAILALPYPPKLIIVDTLHRFLLGDENSAQDAKSMLDACADLMREFNCSVLLVHHTGVSDEAQHRARGSSAWRGALDIEISIVPAKSDSPIEIVQRKSKDSEMAQPLACRLVSEQIPGWFDDDGEPVTSAVVLMVDAPEKAVKKLSKVEANRARFERAWFGTGASVIDGLPHITRSALREFLLQDGLSEGSAANELKPSSIDKLIGSLLHANIIKHDAHGWSVIDAQTKQALMIKRT